MKKNLFLSLFFLACGFLIHAFLFPDVLSNGIPFLKQSVPNTNNQFSTPKENQNVQQDFITKIEFDGSHFSRHAVSIEVGSYLTITNTNKDNKLMYLSSNNPLLKTPRGYGESEEIRQRIDTRGEYFVADSNNPEEKININVK